MVSICCAGIVRRLCSSWSFGALEACWRHMTCQRTPYSSPSAISNLCKMFRCCLRRLLAWHSLYAQTAGCHRAADDRSATPACATTT